MDAQQQQDLIRLLRPIADDEWIVGHRGSEWLGLAPDLEEDLAFSSIHQDEMGHALFFYELLHSLGDPEPDHQVYFRSPEAWHNARLVEQPNGDWATTVLRRYCYEVFDDLRLAALAESSYAPLRDGVKKIRREEAYHLKHFTLWMELLARGGEEAFQRLTAAIPTVWGELGDLFYVGESEAFLHRLGLPGLTESVLRERWRATVRSAMEDWGLPWPGDPSPVRASGRLGHHLPDMTALLDTMTEVRRFAPDSVW